MSQVPADLRYTKSHEWVRVLPDGSAEIGITDHAQHALGDLVFVEPPEAGRKVGAGEACAVVESVKAASDVYSPIAGTVLAGNAHSTVQAAVVPVGRSEVWGVQYHPEFDLGQMALLMKLYASDMVAQGYYADRADLDAGNGKWQALAADPGNAGLAWQLGLDRDTIDDGFRRLEIANWLARVS